jgi:hypothetical protein
MNRQGAEAAKKFRIDRSSVEFADYHTRFGEAGTRAEDDLPPRRLLRIHPSSGRREVLFIADRLFFLSAASAAQFYFSAPGGLGALAAR